MYRDGQVWTKVDTVTFDKVDYEIYVDQQGQWTVNIDEDQEITAGTKPLLLTKLRNYTRKTGKIAIALTLIDYRNWSEKLYITRVIVTGLHARNRSILYTDAHGNKRTDGDRSSFYRQMTDEEIQEVARLKIAKEAAAKAFDAYLASRKVNVTDLIEHAMTTPAPIDTKETV